MAPSFDLRRRLLVWGVLCVVALTVLTAQVRAPDRRRIGLAGTAVQTALVPLVAGLSRMSDALAGSWALLHEIGTLRVENARLLAEVARLREENARLRPSADENVRLRTLLGFKQAQSSPAAAAQVVGRDPSHWFNTILVDRGTGAGVQRNDPVVTSEGLVGHVVEAGPGWARVLLVVDPRSAAGVVIDRSREAGVAEGLGRPVLRVTYLSRDSDVHPGDQIVTSGLGQIYPRGLPVGTVIGVHRASGDLFKEAIVRPAADLDHLEDVLIVLRGERAPIPR